MASARATNGRGEQVNQGSGRKRGALVLALAVLGLSTISARATDFFDWGAVNTPVNPAYVQTPPLTDANASQVKAFLTSQIASGKTTAVQVRAGVTLDAATISLIFNDPSVPVKYVFADYEGSAAVTQTTTLVNQLKPTAFGTNLANNTAYISNFALAPIPVDTTTPPVTTYTACNSPVNPYMNSTDFRNSGVNMSSEALYPGIASFRNPIIGSDPATGGSTAPNLRSALFTLPIERLTLATSNIGAGQLHIPFISRFNNVDNPTLQNSTSGGQPALDTSLLLGGQSVAGQLLSRNDFQALVLHYKMRGADSYQLLDPGVVGYTVAQYEQDAQDGWNNSLVNGVLGGIGGRVATMPTVVTFNGVKETIEQAGVVWSAVTNDGATLVPGSNQGLAILISNLSATNGSVAFNTRINGATLSGNSPTLVAGSHMILRFTKSGNLWSQTDATPEFFTAALASRDGIGIPEPTSLALLGIGALGVLGRRRRRA